MAAQLVPLSCAVYTVKHVTWGVMFVYCGQHSHHLIQPRADSQQTTDAHTRDGIIAYHVRCKTK